MHVIVVGAGVIGLSCAVRLLEVGHTVRVIARDFSPHTTSNLAAAVWYPYKAFPFDRIVGWGATTFREFVRLAADPAAGIMLRDVLEVLDLPIANPWWRDAVPDFRHATAAELPPPYPDGYMFCAPVIEMDRYLPYLQQRAVDLGATLEQRELADFSDLVADVIVNCSGLGARELAHDATVYPIRGQIIRTTRAELETVWIDDAEYSQRPMSYIIPRSDDCILGGVAEDQQWSLDVDPATAAAILERCTVLEPRLAEATILEHRVGLRPARPTIRLEREQTDQHVIIHNYGHGGAGVTLSWGCAAEVAALVQAEMNRIHV